QAAEAGRKIAPGNRPGSGPGKGGIAHAAVSLAMRPSASLATRCERVVTLADGRIASDTAA
ncbi:MAG: hypothetical protein ACK44Y_05495, partial [Novosphingobium sp.]